jgi:predicted small lipoprotein YifL
MKKSVFSIFAVALVCFTLASCGEKLMSEAEVKAKVDELYNQQASGVASEADAQCDQQFDARVQAEVDRMVAEAAAAAPAPAPTPASKK